MSGDDLQQHRRFTQKIEQAIRAANREVLHPVVDPLSEEKVLSVAVEVSKRRAAYIDATLKLGTAGGHNPSGEELRRLRQEYEEARAAFGELIASIEHGYIDLPTS